MNKPAHIMTYRPEIDGLRAIAVLPVMLFHAGFTAFSGGFVGVDIFFVLSGYLITSIIVGEAEQGKFSLLRFYERRARRILPALLLIVTATLPFAYFWMTRAQWHDYAESLVGVATFSSNILFWLQTDYFATASELKPLLHTWSLAVEEQFYIVFPLLVMLIMRIGRKAMLPVFIIIALASLGWSEYAAHAYPSANFFLLPSRAWELLAGSCCALWLRHANMAIDADLRRHAMPGKPARHILMVPEFVQHIAAIAGIVMIIIAIVQFDPETPFPSLYALLPVCGTMALILFLRPDFWLTRLLSVRPLVAIGLISYGAYLWHQPVLAFYRLTNFAHDPVMLSLMLVISLMLAAFSYWLVEQPVRYALLKKRSASLFLALSAICLLVMAAIGFAARFTPMALPHEEANGTAIYSGEGYDWRESFAASDNSKAPIILYGDSVARQYIGGLRSNGGALEFIGAPSCVALPLAFSGQGGDISAQCLGNIDRLYAQTQKTPDALIVMAQDWHVRLQTAKGDAIGDGGIPGDPAAIEALLFNLELIAEKLPKGARLILVGQIPSTQDGGNMLRGGPARCAQFDDIICPRNMPRALVTAGIINKRLADFAALHAHIGFVDPMDSLCDGDKCTFWRDGQPLYYDNSHITALAARPIVETVIKTAQTTPPKAE